MENPRLRMLLGLLCMLGGIFFLLQNFGLIPADLPWLWILMFGLGGLAFLFVFLTQPSHWWPILPGLSLLGLAALIGWTSLMPDHLDAWGAAIFMGALALAFWLIYLVTRGNDWWAMIPGGVLASVALVIASSALPVTEDVTAGLMLLGLALTFGLVYLLPSPGPRKRWALIPGGILLFIGLIIIAALTQMLNYIFALLLLIAGAVLILRSLRAR